MECHQQKKRLQKQFYENTECQRTIKRHWREQNRENEHIKYTCTSWCMVLVGSFPTESPWLQKIHDRYVPASPATLCTAYREAPKPSHIRLIYSFKWWWEQKNSLQSFIRCTVWCSAAASVAYTFSFFFYLWKTISLDHRDTSHKIITTSASAFTSAFYTETNKDNCDLYPKLNITNEQKKEEANDSRGMRVQS